MEHPILRFIATILGGGIAGCADREDVVAGFRGKATGDRADKGVATSGDPIGWLDGCKEGWLQDVSVEPDVGEHDAAESGSETRIVR